MRPVTLLLSGVPQYVTLRDLSYNLDLLFNTSEINTFKVRDLPNHPHNHRRQIALDFRSSYDAMEAQEKLDGYTYELDNGREYTLHAKINKFEEYMCSETSEYEGSHWYGDDWMALTMIPNVSDQDMYRAHARLDDQIEFLKYQKHLLIEAQKLKRKNGSMVSSLYEVPTLRTQHNNNVEQACESETEVSPPKISRSTSRDRSSSSKPPRSRSRENTPRGSHRSRSKDRGYVLPKIEWYEERTKTQEFRSQSREHPWSSTYSRDRRPSSRDHIYPRHCGQRSRSNNKDRNRSSTSRERGVRARSRSKEWLARPRESRSKEHKSRSRERRSRSRERRSRSRERIYYRRSRSRDRTRHDARVSRSDWGRRGRRLRSPDRRTNQLAIIPRSPRGKSSSEWSADYLKAGTPTGDTKHKVDIANEQVCIKVEKDANNAEKEADTKIHKTDTYKKEIKKAEKTVSRVKALSKDIMILVAILIDKIVDSDNIRISASNKLTLIKTLETLVQQRLVPIARDKKNDEKEVMTKYKMDYPMEGDLKMIKQMLDEIPKLEMNVPEATVTVCPKSENTNVIDDILDVNNAPTEQECTTANLTPVESTDNAPQIRQELTEAPIIIIDIDSAKKPVPRRPQFVIKCLVENMNKVIKRNKLDGEIKLAQLKHVLGHILKNLLKGQGCLPYKEIIQRFREEYPMENDERFVRNMIKDIKDGKYPGLTEHIVEAPDDVVFIDQKYDVVTVSDSDEDDMDIQIINQPATPQHTPTEQHTEEHITDVINLDCESRQAKPNSNPTQPMQAPSNVHIKTDPVNPDQKILESTNSSQDKPCSNTVQATHLDIQENTRLTDPVQAMTGPANTSQANVDANSCQAKTAAKPGLHMAELSSSARANTGLPSQAHTGFVNPDQAKTDVPNSSQANTSFANLSLASPYHVNASQAKKGAYNPSQAQTGPGNPSQAKNCPNIVGQTIPGLLNAKKGPNNPSQAKTGSNNAGQANKSPINPSQLKKGTNNPSQLKKGTNNPSQLKKGTNNPSQLKKGTNNPSQLKKCTNNPSQLKKGTNNPGQIISGSGNPGQANQGPNYPGQTNTTPVNIDQVTTGFDNLSKAKTCPISSQAASNKEHQKKARLDITIQNLQSKVQETPVKDKNSPEDFKYKVNINTIEDNDNNPKVTGITIVPSLNEFIAKSNANEMENVPIEIKNTIEDNDNNPKVTGITIVTSLNELFAKSNANETENVPIEIKKEIEIEEEKPRVTSITIMTSDAELFSLGQEDRKEVSEIKNETDVLYYAEDNLVNDIERAFDDANFCNCILSERVKQNNSVNSEQFSVNNSEQFSSVTYSEQFSSVNNSEQFSSVTYFEQFSSVNNSEQFSSKTASVPQAGRTEQDEEETIESIVKYVASMY